MKKHSIIDDCGYEWRWNGVRVYMVEAEKEMRQNGEDVEQNGYPANSWEDAVKLLEEYGYIGETKED